MAARPPHQRAAFTASCRALVVYGRTRLPVPYSPDLTFAELIFVEPESMLWRYGTVTPLLSRFSPTEALDHAG